jgi:hypothetical protein
MVSRLMASMSLRQHCSINCGEAAFHNVVKFGTAASERTSVRFQETIHVWCAKV